MDLNKLYKMQEELDKFILEKHNIKMSKEELLNNTILSLLVEVGELANTTRCFKHWSTKGMMDKEVVIDELADVWHFYLSIGNQIGVEMVARDIVRARRIINATNDTMTEVFNCIYNLTTHMQDAIDGDKWVKNSYVSLGMVLPVLSHKLGFTDEEVEQAYLKKHEENYKRQREGY